MQCDVVVVGAGLFGSVIAEALRRNGVVVLVVDDRRPNAGSPPAACLMRPSWFSSLGRAVYDPALRVLDELYSVQDVVFKAAKVPVTVHWCDPRKILQPPDLVARATRVVAQEGGWRVETSSVAISAKKVVVAAGVWSGLLASVEGGVVGQAGLACLWRKARIEEPFIQAWAPYRQISAFNRGDGLWVGDSSAALAQNWSAANAGATVRRCSKAVGRGDPPEQLFGIRPYVKAKPCYLKEARPGLWVATGGAKNGTIAAAWCASELVKYV